MRFKIIAAIVIKFVLTGAITRVAAQVPPTIVVEEIEITGNTVLTDFELERVVAPLEGQEIPLEQILELRGKLTNYYIERGYTTSGAFFPPQKFTDGIIQIQILEGTLEAIKIQGLKNLSENYLKSRLPEEGKPLNRHQLARSLARLQNNPLIKKINAELIQESVGKNILVVDLEENLSWDVQIKVIEGYSRSIGSLGGNIKAIRRNFWVSGDELTIDSSLTEGLTRFGGSYSFPINQLDGKFTLTFNVANSQLVEDVISDLGIEADYSSVKFAFQQPIISTRSESLILGLGIEHIDSETFVLKDLSFSFTDGLEDGKSQVTVLRLTQEYVKNGATTLIAFNSEFNVGIDAFDATKTEVGIDGIYWSWRGDFQFLKALNEEKDLVMATRAIFQLSPDKLLPIEQFTMGGLGSVLGYRANLGVADNGAVGIIELQLPLAQGDKWGEIKLIPFFNVGNISNNDDRETTGSNTFASAGLGLRYRLPELFEARINYAIPLIDLTGFGETDTEERFTFFMLIRPLRF